MLPPESIAAGEFAPGDRLPPITALMEQYPGLNTIRRAQQLLVDDGLVETGRASARSCCAPSRCRVSVDVLAELRVARAVCTDLDTPGQQNLRTGRVGSPASVKTRLIVPGRRSWHRRRPSAG